METTGSKALENGELRATPTPAIDEEQPRYSRREILLTMSGVLLIMLLASLDQTIVSTALPRIVSELHGIEHYTWVATAYLLSSTVMIPIYGKLSDIFGRKPIFLIGVIIFLIGSGLSGAAQTMEQLIAFRAFQGLGAAALLPIAIAVIGDLFTPRERGRWQGLTGAVFGLSSILGPTLGGWITENSTWRWVFYVNLPIGIAALFVLIFLMPTLRSNTTRKPYIDYVGAALLIAGTVPLLLGLSWGGNQYAWDSVQIISLLVGAVVVLIGFVFYEAYLERQGKQPIIEPGMFKNRSFALSVIITMITSMGMFGAIFFLPLYGQGVLGITATQSGLILTPLMFGLIVTSVVSGQLVSRWGRYKWVAITGMIVAFGGALLLLRLDINSTNTDMLLAMVVLGAGLGFGMALYTLIVQNAMPTKIGQATSSLTFFRQIGGTVALAAMGSVLNSAFAPAFKAALPDAVKRAVKPEQLNSLSNPNILLDARTQAALRAKFAPFGAAGQELYNQLMHAVKVGLTDGVHQVFIMSVIVLAIGLVLVFFLPELPLLGGKRTASAGEVAQDATENTVAPAAMLH